MMAVEAGRSAWVLAALHRIAPRCMGLVHCQDGLGFAATSQSVPTSQVSSPHISRSVRPAGALLFLEGPSPPQGLHVDTHGHNLCDREGVWRPSPTLHTSPRSDAHPLQCHLLCARKERTLRVLTDVCDDCTGPEGPR